MPLSTVQTLFVEATGRQDLDNTSGTGAKFYLNAAQRWLDGQYENPKSQARHSVPMAAGQYVVHVPFLRVVHAASLTNTSGRTPLSFVGYEELRGQYSALLTSQETNEENIAPESLRGTAGFYTVVTNSLSPYSREGNFPSLVRGREGILPGDDFIYKSILVLGPTSVATSLDLEGLFYQPELTLPGDRSYWTEVRPEVLVMAAAMIHEGFLRNSEGVKDMKNQTDTLMFGTQADIAEVDGPLGYVMEG